MYTYTVKRPGERDYDIEADHYSLSDEWFMFYVDTPSAMGTSRVPVGSFPQRAVTSVLRTKD